MISGPPVEAGPHRIDNLGVGIGGKLIREPKRRLVTNHGDKGRAAQAAK
jgi:hypothetical protein